MEMTPTHSVVRQFGKSACESARSSPGPRKLPGTPDRCAAEDWSPSGLGKV